MSRSSRRAAAALAVVAGLLGATLADASPANASGTGYRNEQTKRCLDDSFAFGLRTIPCNYSGYQDFFARGQLGAPKQLANQGATGRCVDNSVPYGLRAFPCNDLAYQLWYDEYTGGREQFRSLITGYCLDDSLAFGLRTYPCNGSSYQKWLFIWW